MKTLLTALTIVPSSLLFAVMPQSAMTAYGKKVKERTSSLWQSSKRQDAMMAVMEKVRESGYSYVTLLSRPLWGYCYVK